MNYVYGGGTFPKYIGMIFDNNLLDNAITHFYTSFCHNYLTWQIVSCGEKMVDLFDSHSDR